MRAAGPAIVKAAVMARRLSDCITLRNAMRGHRDVIAIAMGPAGQVSRLCPFLFGSLWTYGGEAAPGQVSPDALIDMYRVRNTTPATTLYAVTGAPLGHSASPAMHNAALAAAGLDAVYVPLETRDPADLLAFADAIGVQGVSVTAPLKVALREHGVAADEFSARIGAVNTIRRAAAGWEGRNFDVAGFLAPIERRGIRLTGRRAVILGAGGAARSAVWGLRAQGARIAISARRREAADALASELHVESTSWPPDRGWDLLVNTTPVGTWPNADAAPIGRESLAGPLVYDMVYNPLETTMLRWAREAGAQTIGGLEMLVAQACRQFEWWTGMTAPAAAVERGAAGVPGTGIGEDMRTTTFEEFVELSRRGTFVPVWREIMADLLTPVSAFLKIAEHSDYAFLLESVEGGEHVGRYSFLGKDPFMILRGRDAKTTVEQAGVQTGRSEPFIDVLRGLMTEFQAPFVPELPRFIGGAVGYLDYDAAEWFESAVALDKPPADRDQAAFMIFDTILAFDHVKHRILAVANARLRPGEDLRGLYDFACAKIDFLERELERNLSRAERRDAPPFEVVANQSRESFEGAVKKIQEDIAAGEIYQAVLSQRFDASTSAPAFDVYRALRHINPSPYMFFIRMGEHAIVGASPEMLVRVEGRHVETHPIAGTRRRGANPDEDQRLADELRRNEKERAEHVMLVDLGRNDIGRVSEVGSVRVPQFMTLERFSHVMHLVSRVEGRLAEDRDRLDALVATFPAGTLTGAPKIRAMQIIGGLEPSRRGLYGGAVGYLDFAGNLDFCIAIRTIAMRGQHAAIQAGAGIVADSHPAAEFEETQDKARALVQALEMANRGSKQ